MQQFVKRRGRSEQHDSFINAVTHELKTPVASIRLHLETLQRRNKRHDFAALEQIIRDYTVREIVVGLPLRMSGAEGTQSEKMQSFAEDLRKRFRLPVHLWDERLTSAEANRLLRETELSIEKRAKAVDRMAAVLILQAWMEKRLFRPSQPNT